MQTYVKALVDRAALRVGNPHKLADEMGIASSTMYDWIAGRQKPSPADRARLAGFAGEDAVQELVRATLETAKGDRRREQLQQVLGKLSQATGAVLNIAGLGLASLVSLAMWSDFNSIRCVVKLNR